MWVFGCFPGGDGCGGEFLVWMMVGFLSQIGDRHHSSSYKQCAAVEEAQGAYHYVVVLS